MATNYELDSGKTNIALTELLTTSSISQALVTLLETKSATSQVFDHTEITSEIKAGTDVVFVEAGGTIDLSTASSANIKDLNLLVFDTDNTVDVTLNNQFKGSVVLGDGDNAFEYNGNQRITVTAGDGDNIITVGNGHDTIIVGDGDDIITTGNGNNLIVLGGGNDTVITGNGNNYIKAGSGNDTITTGNGADTIEVSSGNDTIDAGNGNDLVIVKNHVADSTGKTIIFDGGKGIDTLNMAEVVINSVEQVGSTHVLINLLNGTQLNVNNVEKFVIDFNKNQQTDTGETVLLTGLLNYFADPTIV